MPLRQLQAAELAAWRAGRPAAAAAAAGSGYCRLATEGEVAPLVAQAAELVAPKKDPDEGAGC